MTFFGHVGKLDKKAKVNLRRHNPGNKQLQYMYCPISRKFGHLIEFKKKFPSKIMKKTRR